jgi:dipeptide/tripeptide permease
VFSAIVYLISIPAIIASIVWKKHRAKIALIAGIMAITAGLGWVYSVQSFKGHFAQEAASTGGLIGQEWKGQENTIVNGIIIMGTGHYFVILAGIIAILAYVVEKVYRKQEPPLGTATNKEQK